MKKEFIEIEHFEQNIPEQLRTEYRAAHHVSPQTNRALFQFRKRLNLKDNEFVTLLALYTLSGGKVEFNASYLRILSLLEEIPSDVAEQLTAKEPGAIKWGNQKVSRRLKALSNRLGAQGLGGLLKYEGGGKLGKDGKRQVTQFNLELVRMVFQALAQAFTDPNFFSGAQRSIDRQVDSIMAELPRTEAEVKTQSRECPKLLKEYRNMRTWLKLLDEIIAQGRDPDDLKRHIDQAVIRGQVGVVNNASYAPEAQDSMTQNEGLSSNMGARARGRASITAVSLPTSESPSLTVKAG